MLNYKEKGTSFQYKIKSTDKFAAGDLVVVGSLVGVAVNGAKAYDGTVRTDEQETIVIRGVFEAPVTEAFTQGAKVYAAADGTLTATAGDILAGYALNDAEAGGTIDLKLVG